MQLKSPRSKKTYTSYSTSFLHLAALLGACERHGRYSEALEIYDEMMAEGLEPNAATRSVLQSVGRKGAEEVARQQAISGAISGVLGIAGAAIVRSGLF